MKTIRKSIFETNSSSTHTIVIDKTAAIKDVNFISFGLDEFGWQFDKFTDIADRAAYLWTYLVYKYEEYDSSTKEYDYTKVYEWRDKLEKVLNDHGIQCEFKDPSSERYFYIDHCSGLTGYFEDMIENDNEKLLKFLLGSETVIFTGNDNDEGKYDDEIVQLALDPNKETWYKGN